MRRLLPASVMLAGLASCVPPPRPVVPPAIPQPAPRPPAPPPAALAPDWNDWPRTPGNWYHRRYEGRSSATFGIPDAANLVLSCTGDGRMLVNVSGAGGGPLTIRTSSVTRVLPTVPLTPAGAGVQAQLAASDPLLDAIAFSRGRFTVERVGAPPLVLPPYAEVGRVVEDCRG